MTTAARITCGTCAMLVVAVPLVLYGHSTGPDPGYTAAPGQPPMACASAGCHSNDFKNGGPINAGGGSVTATFSTSDTYPPGGGPVTITITVSDPVNKHYGFQMTALVDGTNTPAGDFTPVSGQLVLCANNQPKPKAGCGSQLEYIEHNTPSTTSWTFTWTPPATNIGKVHFYLAGNAVNRNGIPDGGDHVYTNNYVLTPLAAFVCTNTSIPVITSIVSATDFGGFSSFAPGSYLEIKGVNLSQNTRTWALSDFSGSNAPTKLDGVSAKINGKDAFMYYISPGQINVQAPADTATGPVAITVTNCNATSTPTMVTEAGLAPGMLAPASFNVGGKQYMAALFADQFFVGNTGLINGVAFRPAKPGDSITAYGLGFGSVTPTIAPGVITASLNSLATTPFSISFGSTPATTTYAGLAPNFVGLYQFNITVPNVADGDYQINITVGSVKVPQTMFLTVHK
jgi:uncharacterized protein (TIGR03437 family)